ncbi:DUF5119 domain-containing protein [Bacteroides graminisolvens]|uniref:DUF5119 domain-containing protein n=1 Tax=Bacteroides graminisolvens TaxID=477666 RepID=UPI0029C6F9A9|nr:DUF5119 domain-containing protein [Bacteroides graminisolvens]
MKIRKQEYKKRFLSRNSWFSFVSTLLLPAALIVCAVACTEGTLDNPPTEGRVVIHASWNSASPPATGLRFYFYPLSGGSALTYDAASTGFEGNLPAGSYRVIACSTDASRAVYEGMESYSTASVTAVTTTDSRSLSYYAQPSGVYALHISELRVPLQDVVETSSVPDTLSRRVNLSFLLLGGESLSSLSGLMRGIQPTVLIATKTYRGEAGVTSFTASVSGNRATARVGVLGLLDPLGNLPYRNLMDLTLTLKDGSVQTTEVDLTRLLSEVLKANGGTIPLELPVEVELRLIDAQLVASVKPWQSGSGEGGVK